MHTPIKKHTRSKLCNRDDGNQINKIQSIIFFYWSVDFFSLAVNYVSLCKLRFIFLLLVHGVFALQKKKNWIFYTSNLEIENKREITFFSCYSLEADKVHHNYRTGKRWWEWTEKQFLCSFSLTFKSCVSLPYSDLRTITTKKNITHESNEAYRNTSLFRSAWMCLFFWIRFWLLLLFLLFFFSILSVRRVTPRICACVCVFVGTHRETEREREREREQWLTACWLMSLTCEYMHVERVFASVFVYGWMRACIYACSIDGGIISLVDGALQLTLCALGRLCLCAFSISGFYTKVPCAEPMFVKVLFYVYLSVRHYFRGAYSFEPFSLLAVYGLISKRHTATQLYQCSCTHSLILSISLAHRRCMRTRHTLSVRLANLHAMLICFRQFSRYDIAVTELCRVPSDKDEATARDRQRGRYRENGRKKFMSAE